MEKNLNKNNNYYKKKNFNNNNNKNNKYFEKKETKEEKFQRILKKYLKDTETKGIEISRKERNYGKKKR